MKQKYLLPLAGIILIAAGAIISLRHFNQAAPTTTLSKSHTILPKEVTVTLDKNGFSPKEVTIKAGSAIRWKNISGDKQTVNSDDYPTNQLHKELNFGIFNNGSTLVYTFTESGTYGYHNQLHHEQQGRIVVTK